MRYDEINFMSQKVCINKMLYSYVLTICRDIIVQVVAGGSYLELNLNAQAKCHNNVIDRDISVFSWVLL